MKEYNSKAMNQSLWNIFHITKNPNGQAKGNALNMNQKVHACKMDDCLFSD